MNEMTSLAYLVLLPVATAYCVSPRWAVPHGGYVRAQTTHRSAVAPILQEQEEATTDLQTGAEQLERFFFDRAEVYVRSGAGGDGAIGFVGRRPAGGSGGAGGNVYVECTEDYNTLGHLGGRGSFHAGRGSDADARQSGRDGKDAVIRVPPNCLVIARDSNMTLGKLVSPGERLLVAQGGIGGVGNGELWQRTKSGNGKAREPPGGTERMWLTLSMTLVADVGLVGVPNAGKSTLLRAVTRARPKVADYPFTTLIPNLGVCDMAKFELRGQPMVWLDIPGLIEGAAAGRGLGHAFLRHTERCRLLVHLIDGENDDPVGELSTIDRELASYSPKLAATPQVVLLTKADLPHVADEVEERLAALKGAVGHGRVLSISSHDGQNLAMLLQRTRKLLDQMRDREVASQARTRPTAGADGSG